MFDSVRIMTLQKLKKRGRSLLLRASHEIEALVVGQGASSADANYHAQIIGDLNHEGVHVTTLDRLIPDTAPRVMAGASALLSSEPASEESTCWHRAGASTDLTAEALLAKAPELYLLGLHANLIDLVRRYLRLPVAYHGAVLRHSLIDGQNAGPRFWHQDAEDFHVLRMVVYLNDVTLGGGPFEYIPRSLGITYGRFAGINDNLTNEHMKRVVPVEKWKRCTGPAGTVVLADTAKVFHHESLQTERERSVIMIGYSSRRPNGMELAMRHFPVERVKTALMRVVPPENYAHVFDWRHSRS
jgi:hypothetical protein